MILEIENIVTRKQAMRFEGTNDSLEAIREWSGLEIIEDEEGVLEIVMLDNSTVYALTGDYLIKGIEDEFYPCDESIFDKSYKIIGGSEEDLSDI